jgi:hypothetical protein
MNAIYYTKTLIFVRKYLVLFKLHYTKISVLISVKETLNYRVIFKKNDNF